MQHKWEKEIEQHKPTSKKSWKPESKPLKNHKHVFTHIWYWISEVFWLTEVQFSFEGPLLPPEAI